MPHSPGHRRAPRSRLSWADLRALGIATLAGVLCGACSPGATRKSGGTGQADSESTPYDGPLIDSHAHIVSYGSLEETEPKYRVDYRSGTEQNEQLRASKYIESLDRNHITCVVGFHAVSLADGVDDAPVDGVQLELLDHAARLHRDHGDRFKLFSEVFRDNPLEWYDPQRLGPALETGSFTGLGEVQFANKPFSDANFDERNILTYPNDPQMLEVYGMRATSACPSWPIPARCRVWTRPSRRIPG